MEEIWKKIKGYEDYEISNLGRVKSYKLNKRGNILTPAKYGIGYFHIVLNNNGVKTLAVHRLVAQAFIPNPNNYSQINHKDENPSNNNVNNLEWCDAKYNNNYGHHGEKISNATLNHKGDKIIAYDINNHYKIYRNAYDAGRHGFCKDIVSAAVNKKGGGVNKNYYKGYYWFKLDEVKTPYNGIRMMREIDRRFWARINSGINQ